jgi:ADP-ribose pyrophosphatase YjhB (NUDIX family)
MRRVFTASCFIAFERRVLLIHHNLLDLWLPVGGELETKPVVYNNGYEEKVENELESPQEGARREALEETGFEVSFTNHGPRQPYGTPLGFLGYEEHEAGPKGIHMNFCFWGFATHSMYDGKLVPIRPGGHPHPKSDGSWNGFRWVVPGDASTYADLRMPVNVRDCLMMIDAAMRR